MEEVFYRKNGIGVNIEYSVIGYYVDNDKKYMIYTDFITDKESQFGIRIMVDVDKNGQYVRLDKEKEKNIIKKYNEEILNYAKSNK